MLKLTNYRFMCIAILLCSIIGLAGCGDKSMRLVAEADQARFMNKLDEAEDLYKKAISTNPDNGLAYNNYGVMLQLQQKWPESLEKFNKALGLFEKDKNKSIALNNIGLNYDLQGDYTRAKEFYLKSIDADSTNYQSHTNLGSIYLVENEFGKGIDILQKTLQLIEESDLQFKAGASQNVSHFLAICYLKAGKIDEAEKLVAGLIKINPYNEINYSLMGEVFLKKEDYKKAKDNYMKAISFNPKSTNAQAGYGYAIANLDEVDKGLEAVNLALSLDPESVTARIYAGKIHVLKNDTEGAKTLWQEAMEKDPNNTEVKDLLATLEK